jgi:hypothetical protein
MQAAAHAPRCLVLDPAVHGGLALAELGAGCPRRSWPFLSLLNVRPLDHQRKGDTWPLETPAFDCCYQFGFFHFQEDEHKDRAARVHPMRADQSRRGGMAPAGCSGRWTFPNLGLASQVAAGKLKVGEAPHLGASRKKRPWSSLPRYPAMLPRAKLGAAKGSARGPAKGMLTLTCAPFSGSEGS